MDVANDNKNQENDIHLTKENKSLYDYNKIYTDKNIS